MKRLITLTSLIVALSLGTAFVGTNILNAQDQPVKRTILQKTDFPGAEGKELVTYQSEIAPGAESGKHFHPGPEYLYMAEGSMVMEPEGHAPVTLTKGQTTTNPEKHVHNVKNTSTSGPTKIIVFLVAEKGQPLATPVK